PGRGHGDLVEEGKAHRASIAGKERAMAGMQGKTIVVTGAASGIGKATAERALGDGAAVMEVDSAFSRLGEDATGPMIWPLDVTDEAAVAGLMDTVSERYGRIDGVVHAAGIAGGGPVHLLDASSWQEVIDVNLTGTFYVVKHAVRRMLNQKRLERQRGSIVTLASVEGLEGTAGGSAYNAAKGGVVL